MRIYFVPKPGSTDPGPVLGGDVSKIISGEPSTEVSIDSIVTIDRVLTAVLHTDCTIY